MPKCLEHFGTGHRCRNVSRTIRHRCRSVLVLKCPYPKQNGVRTLRHQDTSAPVPKCPSDTSALVPKCLGHFGTDHRGSHACQRRQLRSGRGGELSSRRLCTVSGGCNRPLVPKCLGAEVSQEQQNRLILAAATSGY